MSAASRSGLTSLRLAWTRGSRTCQRLTPGMDRYAGVDVVPRELAGQLHGARLSHGDFGVVSRKPAPPWSVTAPDNEKPRKASGAFTMRRRGLEPPPGYPGPGPQPGNRVSDTSYASDASRSSTNLDVMDVMDDLDVAADVAAGWRGRAPRTGRRRRWRRRFGSAVGSRPHQTCTKRARISRWASSIAGTSSRSTRPMPHSVQMPHSREPTCWSMRGTCCSVVPGACCSGW